MSKLERVSVGPPNARQGEYVRTQAHLWTCGDEVCNCSQVVVERVYRNALAPNAYWVVRIAEGPFRTDGAHYHESEDVEAELSEARTLAESETP